MIRAFIALDLPDAIRENVDLLQREFRKTQAQVSWVKSQSIHITLKFLGNIAPEQVPPIQNALEEIAQTTSSFRLQAGGCGAFPSLKKMRVVWVGLQGDTKPLQELQEKIEEVSIPLGFQAEERPFRPHLTIGRVKGKRRLRALQESLVTQGTFQTEVFDVTDVVLYKSQLRPEGALYTPLYRAKFLDYSG